MNSYLQTLTREEIGRLAQIIHLYKIGDIYFYAQSLNCNSNGKDKYLLNKSNSIMVKEYYKTELCDVLPFQKQKNRWRNFVNEVKIDQNRTNFLAVHTICEIINKNIENINKFVTEKEKEYFPLSIETKEEWLKTEKLFQSNGISYEDYCEFTELLYNESINSFEQQIAVGLQITCKQKCQEFMSNGQITKELNC